MRRVDTEVVVGLFLLLGVVALGYLSVRMGRMQVLGFRGYMVTADFPTVGGLKSGASVEIAGVKVGQVDDIALNGYKARVTLRIDQGVRLQEDTIASIKTKGLIGEKYIRLSPGGSDEAIPPGGRIRETEAPIDIEELIGNYIFGKF
jgi:phospholipid/cholesterol/gamma-HCH transport system substrate-binding protein